LLNLIKKLTKETELSLDLWSLISPIPGILNARGCANFIRWSSTSRRRHRTMTANPVIRPGSKRAHTETTVLGQLKKSQ
jgi:hypothetical protein